MSSSRRDFLKGTASAAVVAAWSNDIVSNILATTPPGKPLETRFKGFADIVLTEAKRMGCSYADVRFTLTASPLGGTATFSANAAGGRGGRGGPGGGGGGGGRGGGGGGGGGGRGGGGAVLRDIPTDEQRAPAGFGIRVIHGGVWGFASSPIVTEDEIRRVTRMATEIARASAIAKKSDVRLAPVPKYVDHYITPMVKPPASVSTTDKNAWAQAIVDKAKGVQGVIGVNVSCNHSYEWR
jgi:TldD protein